MLEEGVPGWTAAGLPLDGVEAAPEKVAEGAGLKALLTGKPPAQIVDLRPSAVGKKAPLKGALVATLDEVSTRLKPPQTRPVLLVADLELIARAARSRLIAAGLSADRVFVVSGGARAIREAK